MHHDITRSFDSTLCSKSCVSRRTVSAYRSVCSIELEVSEKQLPVARVEIPLNLGLRKSQWYGDIYKSFFA